MLKYWFFGRGSSGDESSCNELSNAVLMIKEEGDTLNVVTVAQEQIADGKGNNLHVNCMSPNDGLEVLHSVFYAVSLPSDTSCGEGGNKPLVYHDKKDALQAVKQYKGARFKTFHSEKDAIAFALQPAEQTCSTPKSDIFSFPSSPEPERITAGEKPSPFKGPKSQDMVKLRKAIESGNIQYFSETAWSNPRYLISSGDTPAIMQEGFRYNALHVAAKHKQPELCHLIIKTIEDPKFMALLYSDDTTNVRSLRIAFVTDLYFNTPDKGLCETPLHFASKFGCLKAVQILASHPACDKKRKNKYGLEAKDIICERCPSSSKEFKQQIEEAFEDQYFVPVLRAADNSVQPFIGKPYTKEVCDVANFTENASPCKASLSVMAIAGPMAPKEADMFYKYWKTPPTRFSKSIHHRLNKIRLRDTEKGLERLGRHLAHTVNANWTEYWPSLNVWCDLSTPEGLEVLENHLKQLYYSLSSKALESLLNSHVSSEEERNDDGSPCLRTGNAGSFQYTTPSIISPASSGGISELCRGLRNFHFYEPRGDILSTSPDMPAVLKLEVSLCDSDDTSGNLDEKSFLYSAMETQNGNDSLHVLNNKDQFLTKQVNLQQSEGSDLMNCDTPKRSKLKNGIHNYEDLQDYQTKRADTRNLETAINNHAELKYGITDWLARIEGSSMENGKGDSHNFQSTDYDTDGFMLSEQLIFSARNVAKSVLDVFSDIAHDSDTAAAHGMRVHLLLAEEVLPSIHCLLKSSRSSEKKSTVHSFIGLKIYSEMEKQFLKHEVELILSHISTYLDSHFSVAVSDDEENFEESTFVSHRYTANTSKTKWQHCKCVLKFAIKFYSDERLQILRFGACDCSWLSHHSSPLAASGDWLGMRGFKLRPFGQKECTNISSEDGLAIESGDSESDENFVTPPSSPGGYSDSSEEQPTTPEEGMEVYVEGEFPSKADTDILRALENVPVDPILYPHICRWRHLIRSKDKAALESWPSPSIKECRNNGSKAHTPSPTQCATPLSKEVNMITRSMSKTKVKDKLTKGARGLFLDFMECDEI